MPEPTARAFLGSGTASINSATKSPGNPSAMNVACHGCSAPNHGSDGGASVKMPRIRPPAIKPAPAPNGPLAPNTLIARPRFSAANRSAISDTAPGSNTASPTATPTRASSRCQYSVARPPAAVARLQSAMPTAMSEAPVAAIDDARDRQAHQRVKGREGEAVQHAHQRVVDVQRLLDRADEQRQDLPVHDGKNVRDQQHA